MIPTGSYANKIQAQWFTNGSECWQILLSHPHPKGVPTVERMDEECTKKHGNTTCFTKYLEEYPLHFADELYSEQIEEVSEHGVTFLYPAVQRVYKEHDGIKYYTLEYIQ